MGILNADNLVHSLIRVNCSYHTQMTTKPKTAEKCLEGRGDTEALEPCVVARMKRFTFTLGH